MIGQDVIYLESSLPSLGFLMLDRLICRGNARIKNGLHKDSCPYI